MICDSYALLQYLNKSLHLHRGVFSTSIFNKEACFSLLDQLTNLMSSLKFSKDNKKSRKRSSNEEDDNPPIEEDDEKRSIHSTAKVEIVEDHNNDDDRLSNEQEEQRFEEEIEDLDAVEQIQVEMAVPPGAAEMTQTTSGGRGKLSILSKLP